MLVVMICYFLSNYTVSDNKGRRQSHDSVSVTLIFKMLLHL